MALAGLILVACSSGGDQQAKEEAPAAQQEQQVSYVGEFKLNPAKGPIGADIAATGTGFAANSELTVNWQQFKGVWKTTEGTNNYAGRDYTSSLQPLIKVKTDASGAFSTSFKVPEGFGFLHDVVVTQSDGVVKNKAAFDVSMQVSLRSTSGPQGSPIEFDVKGIGVLPLNNSWEVMYDNQFVGWISSVETDGQAHFSIPATGPVGKHIISVGHGSFTFPYLNMQQSPAPNRPTWQFEYTITPGQPILPPAAELQGPKPVPNTKTPTGSGTLVWMNYLEGPVGLPVTLRATGLPANKEINIDWVTTAGQTKSMIGGPGGERPEARIELGKVTTDASGNLTFDMKTPADTGGKRKIVLAAEGKIVGTTEFRLRPSAKPLSVSTGPAGTKMSISFLGVDDTDTGKILMLTYDNAMLGYACAVTAQGSLTINLPAAGQPGWHFIDLYPGIYKGEDMPNVYNFRIPQLTALTDHPGEKDLPIWRFAFYVTE